jgi:hypothetical protein
MYLLDQKCWHTASVSSILEVSTKFNNNDVVVVIQIMCVRLIHLCVLFLLRVLVTGKAFQTTVNSWTFILFLIKLA